MLMLCVMFATIAGISAADTDNGCQSPDGRRMEDAEIYQKEPNVWQCQKSKLTQIACYVNGRTLAPMQTLVDGVVYFTCDPTEDGFKLRAVGCIHLPSKQIPVGETAQVKEYLFKCVVKDGKLPEFVPYACLFEKRPMLIGETAQDDLYWYQCIEVPNKGIELEVKGCVSDRMRLKDGDVFHSNGFMYRCVDAVTAIKRLGVGCLQMTAERNIVEHAIGDRWAEGSGKGKVLTQCNFNGRTVVKKALQCSFADDDGKELLLDAYCMAKTKNSLHKCGKDNEDFVPKSVDSPTDADLDDARRAGFKICT